jgi:hypothetical protein
MIQKESFSYNQEETLQEKIDRICWLVPQEEPSEIQLRQTSDNFYKSLHLKKLPVKIIEGDWRKAGKLAKAFKDDSVHDFAFEFMNISPLNKFLYYTTERKIWEATRKVIKQNRLRSIRHSVYEVANTAMEYSDYCIGWSLEREKANPFEPLFDNIYSKGFVFLGPIKGESVIFVPPFK